MKEENKTPEKELHTMEKTNLSDTEFKTLVIRILTEMMGVWLQNRGKSEGYTR